MENIIISQDGFIRTITINRPSKLNALNKSTISELSTAFKEAQNDQNTRAIILTGAGNKAFVAGADISEFAHFSINEGKKLSDDGHKILFNLVEELSKPVIAAVNGFALGGGLELAMSCHIRIASDNARLGLPEVSLGVIPGYGGTQRLAQLIGKGRALEMITTAQMIGAKEAQEMGLINHVTTPEELLSRAEKIAGKIGQNSPTAISKAIFAVNSQFKTGVDGFQAEIEAFGDCFETDDFKEGTTAFLEKRKAQFSGS